jgi:hypothetical protein
MSAVLPRSPGTRGRLRDRSPQAPASGDGLGALRVSSFPLSPLEQEILNICLNAPEDPRDVGMLPAMLSAERRRKAPDPSAP